MTGRTYGSAVPVVKEFRCLRRLPMAITQVSRPSLYVLPFQLAWERGLQAAVAPGRDRTTGHVLARGGCHRLELRLVGF